MYPGPSQALERTAAAIDQQARVSIHEEYV